MMKRLLRVVTVILVVLAAIAVVGGGALYFYDQATLSAQARATPQVPPEAAAGQPNPIAISLPPAVNVATVHMVNGRPDLVVLDVRSQAEYDGGHIPGARLIPLSQIPDRLAEVPNDRTVVVSCRSGSRSAQAVQFLRSAGFDDVHNMIGGIRTWNKAGFEVEQ